MTAKLPFISGLIMRFTIITIETQKLNYYFSSDLKTHPERPSETSIIKLYGQKSLSNFTKLSD